LIAEGPFVRTFAWNHSIAPDGRLAVVVALPERSLRELVVVTGLPGELGRWLRAGTESSAQVSLEHWISG